MGTSQTGSGRADDKRQSRRTKVFLVAAVSDDRTDAPRRAHVLDISADGARVHAHSAADAGAMVDLMVGGAAQQAAVVWVDHPNFGVRFQPPLSDERLGRIVAPD